VTLPAAPPGGSRYRNVRDRASYAFALVSVAACGGGVGGHITFGRVVALGDWPPKAAGWPCAEAEEGSSARAQHATATRLARAATSVLDWRRGPTAAGDNRFQDPMARSRTCTPRVWPKRRHLRTTTHGK